MKRILTMQDLSCAGRCSLTEALPVLSAMGLEAAVLPTAVLSSHTAFKNVYGTDLLDMDDQRAADTARNAVYSGIDPESRGLLYGPEDDQIKNYDAGDFKYYVDPSGKVKLLFDSYELGAGALGSPVIDTGFSISAYLNR